MYGQLQRTCHGNKDTTAAQHQGIGKLLVEVAEGLSRRHAYTKIIVIAGEGTRGYYERQGYIDSTGSGSFMFKPL